MSMLCACPVHPCFHIATSDVGLATRVETRRVLFGQADLWNERPEPTLQPERILLPLAHIDRLAGRFLKMRVSGAVAERETNARPPTLFDELTRRLRAFRETGRVLRHEYRFDGTLDEPVRRLARALCGQPDMPAPSRDLERAIRFALGALPALEATSYRLACDGASLAEIADATDSHPHVARAMVRRAERLIAEVLSDRSRCTLVAPRHSEEG